MQEPLLTEESAIQDVLLPRVYTLSEVASHLGVREDDLMVLLPDTAIVLDEPPRFTPANVETLNQLIHAIRQFHTESMDGGDL